MVRRMKFLAALVVAAALSLPGAAGAQVRPLDHACPAGQVPPADFWDVSGTHVRSIECVSWWGVTQGSSLVTYAPFADVSRGQMASFVARALDAVGADLPDSGPGFADTAGHPHQRNIERLAGAGIVHGTAPGRFDPDRSVPRGQMTTFLVRAFEFAAERDLPPGSHGFTDIAGHPHELSIAKAYGGGFAAGTTPTTFHPDRVLNRAQMATFLARLLSAGVAELGATLPSQVPARIHGRGSNVVRGQIPGDQPALVRFTHSGSSNFIVWSIDDRNERDDLLVNEIGSYSGMASVNFGRYVGRFRALEITADGLWSVRILPLSAARGIGPGGGAGTGDEIVEVSALAGRDVHLTHAGSSNFILWAHDGFGHEHDLVVNEIGRHDGVHRLPNGTRWLRISADGAWGVHPR